MALIPRGFRLYCNKKLELITVLGNETLAFMVDGTYHIVTLNAGVYYTHHEQFESDLPAMITDVLATNGVPVICKLGGVYDYADNRTVLVFEHSDITTHHDLDVVGGSAYDLLVGSILNTDVHEDGIFDASKDVRGAILVVYPDSNDLGGLSKIRRTVKDDSFKGKLAIRRSSSTAISGRVSVVSASRLDGSLTVRRKGVSDISGSLSVPIDGLYDLGSFLIVKQS